MDRIDDVIGKLQRIKDSLDHAVQATGGTHDDLADIRDQLGTVGVFVEGALTLAPSPWSTSPVWDRA